jgi:hypothetical protein
MPRALSASPQLDSESIEAPKELVIRKGPAYLIPQKMGFRGKQKFAGLLCYPTSPAEHLERVRCTGKYFNRFADSWTFARAVAERYAGLRNGNGGPNQSR